MVQYKAVDKRHIDMGLAQNEERRVNTGAFVREAASRGNGERKYVRYKAVGE